ncbi:MAG: SIMPL domain-containing protein [Bacteroidetes bacterium]|nr:SIMPL domain-containing protein [Bacteroidota bacterium]
MKTVLFLLLIPMLLFSQEYSNSIKIRANSTVYVMANTIKFNIRLKEEHSDPKEAFSQHKKLESKLLELFPKYNIPDSSVSYSLLNFRKSKNSKREEVFSTHQEIIVKLNSIDDYTEFQIALLNNGFNEFNAVFSTDQLSGIKEQGYKEALELTKEDASAIAKVMNKKLGDILEVNTSTSENPHVDASRGSMAALTVTTSDRGLTEIEQSLAVRTNLEIRFEIIDN